MTLLSAAIGAGVFAAAVYLGMELSKILSATTPARRAQAAPTNLPAAILAFGAVIGACLASRNLMWEDLVMAAIVFIALSACAHQAITTGNVSNYFIFVPLSAILVSDIAQQNWMFLLSPIVPFVPFAIAAQISRGKAIGWDEAKIATLGGAVLGPWFALLAFAAACVTAAVLAWSKKKTREPMLLVPYMTAGIAICLLFTLSRGS
jgi:hypothetical protein